MLQPITPTSKANSSKPNSKRKRFPLLNLEFLVTFLLEKGEFHANAQELSHEEVRTICPAGDIPLLVPRTAHHRPDEKIVHQAELQLDNNFKLNVKLQVLSCRRYSQQGFNVAFRLLELSEEQQDALEAFLNKALDKNIPTASMFS